MLASLATMQCFFTFRSNIDNVTILSVWLKKSTAAVALKEKHKGATKMLLLYTIQAAKVKRNQDKRFQSQAIPNKSEIKGIEMHAGY